MNGFVMTNNVMMCAINKGRLHLKRLASLQDLQYMNALKALTNINDIKDVTGIN